MSRLYFGIALVIAGALLLLPRSGLLPAGLRFWPVVAVILGAWICMRAIVRDSYPLRRRSSWMMLALGVLIAIWGLFDILHVNGYTLVSGRAALGRGWPILLVAFGLALILGKSEDDEDDDGRRGCGGRRGSGRGSGVWEAWGAGDLAKTLGPDWWGWHRDPPAVQRHMSRIGDVHIGRKPWRLDGDFELRHSIGDVRVDLSTADITPGEHRIRIASSIGDVVVLVPSNCSARASAIAVLGAVNVFDQGQGGSPAQMEMSAVVPGSDVMFDICVRTRIGSVRIRRVSAAASAADASRLSADDRGPKERLTGEEQAGQQEHGTGEGRAGEGPRGVS